MHRLRRLITDILITMPGIHIIGDRDLGFIGDRVSTSGAVTGDVDGTDVDIMADVITPEALAGSVE